MRLISFDVGIKNLAYCVFSFSASSNNRCAALSAQVVASAEQKLEDRCEASAHAVEDQSGLRRENQPSQSWSIPEWNCANLLSFDAPEPVEMKPCCHMIKGKRKSDADHPCNKNSKWISPTDSDKTFCELHAKIHTDWIIPKKVNTTSHINKLKLPELEKENATLFLTTTSDISTKKMKKSELIEKIIAYYESKCFRSVNENAQKTKTAGEIDLVTIGRAIRRQLDGDPAIEGITHVVIENQISTIASRMKTIQGMIAQYFIMRFGDKVHIEFVSSHNKLKGFGLSKENREDKKVQIDDSKGTENKKEKVSYKANKSDGIDICRRFFETNPEMRGWEPIFDKSKKRDDLADCFLQGIWYLKSNKIINYADNLKINSVIVS
jgi:hypothetical protein